MELLPSVRVARDHFIAAVPDPQLNHRERNIVFDKERHATMPECVKTALRNPEAFQHRMQPFAQDVALAHWAAIPTLEHVT